MQTNYSSVQEQVSTNYEEATSTQQTAVELQSQAEGVNETAHAVPLSQLYGTYHQGRRNRPLILALEGHSPPPPILC